MKTNWKKHEAVIVAGDSQAFIGWMSAGVECFTSKTYKGNVSRYIKDSPASKVTASSQETYIGAFVRTLKKYKGDVKAMLADYDKAYEYREITSFVKWSPSGQRAKNGKKVEMPTTARTLTCRDVEKDLRVAGFSSIEINAIVKALRLKK